MTSKTGLAIFRIIENQLQIARNVSAKNISIEIKKDRHLSVLFTDDGVNSATIYSEKDFLFNNTITRAGILNGKVLSGKNTEGNNFIKLKIPLSQACC